MSTDELKIPLSKTKIIFIAFGAAVFVALGVWMLSMDDAKILAQRRYNDPFLVHSIGFISIAFFGLCGAVACIKLFSQTPGLIFNADGIILGTGLKPKLIPWHDITGSDTYQVNNQKMLVVLLKNPNKYIEDGNQLKRMLNRTNYNMCGSPITISSNALKMSFQELQAAFDKYLINMVALKK